MLARKRAKQVISIHAPRTGSDSLLASSSATLSRFQSTLPARGATIAPATANGWTAYFNPRSPHGERRVPCC